MLLPEVVALRHTSAIVFSLFRIYFLIGPGNYFAGLLAFLYVVLVYLFSI